MAKVFTRRLTQDTVNPSSLLIGQQLLSAGKLTEDSILKIVSIQRDRNIRFGEAAIDLGLVTRADVQQALARQFEYPVASPDGSEFSPWLVTATNPHCAQSEAYRALRSQLLVRWFADRNRSLAVTSCRRRQGSSVLAANLAILFAQLGERTLLIDANLRNPTQTQLFGQTADVGLTDVLTGRCNADDAISPVAGFDSLFVLPGGAAPPNPQELLSRVAFSYLIETASADAGFDIIVVDTPPLLEYADAQIVSTLTRACVLAVKRNDARVADIAEVRVQLQPTAAALVGAVLFD
jgi:protein-tyrosine kinase